MISDRSGFRFPASEIVREWTGALVSRDEEEPRHPQDFVRGVVDDYAVRNPRPRAPYEAAIRESDFTNARSVAERDNDTIITRAGDFVVLREFRYGPSSTVFEVDLGSSQYISAIVFTVEEFTEGGNLINLYTSDDDVNYTGLDHPAIDVLRSYKLGEARRVSIGRKAQYIQLRIDLLEGEISPSINFSQFDVLGAT